MAYSALPRTTEEMLGSRDRSVVGGGCASGVGSEGGGLSLLKEQWRSFVLQGQLSALTLTLVVVVGVLLYVHRNYRLIRDGSPGRPARLSHSS